ncbi:MAG: hypothetical protein IKD81_08575 [Eubacteriaceae bacterium]|nr:hypothetical protein [Eubacteriaceae bacterium]
MEKIRQLGIFQKAVLVIMIVMTLTFAFAYHRSVSREGYLYHGSLLMPREENGSVVYSGRVGGKDASFTVTGDTAEFIIGDKTWGPYTVREVPELSSYPDDESSRGMEILLDGEVVFSGTVWPAGVNQYHFYEKTTYEIVTEGSWVFVTEPPSVEEQDSDPLEPSLSDAVALVNGPELTHRGDWGFWFLGVIICAVTAFSIFFADELFRWNLSFRIREPEKAEPSDWEITGRYLSWGFLPLVALTIFAVGLRL